MTASWKQLGGIKGGELCQMATCHDGSRAEANAPRRVQHPTSFGSTTSSSTWKPTENTQSAYIVMEYVDGTSL